MDNFGVAVLEFCTVETATLLTIRLEMLCDSKCEDFALKLVAVCRKCVQQAEESLFAQSCTPSQKEYWHDLHIALLYRFKKNDEVVLLLKQLSLDDGYQLVKRFMARGSTSTTSTELKVFFTPPMKYLRRSMILIRISIDFSLISIDCNQIS